jgi:hypothetical protein
VGVSFTVNPPNASDWRPPKPGGSGPPNTIYTTPDALRKMAQAIQLVGSPYAEWSDPRHFGGDRDGVISTLWNRWGEMIGEGSIILCGVPTWTATAMTL